MELILRNHSCKYALEQIMLMLFPAERPNYPERLTGSCPGAVSSLNETEARATSVCRIIIDGKSYTGRASAEKSLFTDEINADRLRGRIIKLAFYRAALKYLPAKPEWGALSGIRPAKLMSALLEEGLSEGKALKEFIRTYDASQARAELCLDAARESLKAKNSLGEDDICLYIGIPFCPTRCAYCSFVSASVQKSMKLIEPYLEALYLEIDAAAERLKALNKRVIAVYFGGGTPTTISPEQSDRLFNRLEEKIDLAHCREITVEAGRPDTVTEEKMRVLRAHGVTRVSVNPQTMSDEILGIIGRKHSAEDVLRAMEIVRRVGGFEINMDLIAGLPGDSPEGFKKTIDTCIALRPENLTVHTLSLKRGSDITVYGTKIPEAEAVGECLNYGMTALRQAGYAPYYPYRQKFMSGGFENVGWSLKGSENLYNIAIMEELCSIVALGGGGSTKIVHPGGLINRVFAPKYPQEYIQNIDKVCEDKRSLEL
ncbi:MAG: coproporphyrinogen dehydrogenase HemZ [Oscillospiraceae bacterium]|nr:coproporphyrinogen dehydrogenase HemZ [Oscillospiraceae bacterium]